MKNLYILGESGIGKSTICKELASETGFNLVESYTTRHQRNNDDTDHTFIDRDKFLNELYNTGEIIYACQKIGGELYMITSRLLDECNIIIVDEIGLGECLQTEALLNTWQDGHSEHLIYLMTGVIRVNDNARLSREVISSHTKNMIDSWFVNDNIDDVVSRMVHDLESRGWL